LRASTVRGRFSAREIEIGQISDKQLQQLLRALTATTLDREEIVGAYAKQGTKIANDCLGVHRMRERAGFTCGLDPHFVAAVVNEEGKVQNPSDTVLKLLGSLPESES
jgi:hypothetical protein